MLHEWLGYIFVLIGLAHVLINYRTFIAHFQKPAARIATAGCIVLIAVMTFVGGTGKIQASQHPAIRILDRNADGVVDSKEIQTVIFTLNKLDMEHNGAVSAEDILAAISPKQIKK